ncbi:hypothetical protein GCM10009624_27700 [Gordonia sinesedis]
MQLTDPPANDPPATDPLATDPADTRRRQRPGRHRLIERIDADDDRLTGERRTGERPVEPDRTGTPKPHDVEPDGDGGKHLDPDRADGDAVDRSGGDPPDGPGRRTRRRGWGARQWIPAISLLVGATVVTTFFAIGVWQRRWIADDGLIVLRTLRNLFAGNGPVFNAGERVEANTSTAWTYVLWFWAWVTDGQLEYVALWVALVLSVSAIPIAMFGTARLLSTRLGGLTGDGYTLLLPLGSVIYIALPPARDFATSGLENGLCIFWAAVLWCLLIAWSRRRGGGGRATAAVLFLAFWAGLAPLVRPELTVIGGLALLMVVVAPSSWWLRIGVVLVAAVLPVGYQIFRMGYYALLVPNPAVAKDASGSKWQQGFAYLTNLFGPYVLILPVVLAIVAGVLLAVGYRWRVTGRTSEVAEAAVAGADTDAPSSASRRSWRERLHRASRSVQTPAAVVTVTVLGGLIVGVYWLRQGGDFMHGRVLLTPLFILLLPVMVVPVTIPAQLRTVLRGDRSADRAAAPAATQAPAQPAEDADSETFVTDRAESRPAERDEGGPTERGEGRPADRDGEGDDPGRDYDVDHFGRDDRADLPDDTTQARDSAGTTDGVARRRRRAAVLQLAGSAVMAALVITTAIWAILCHQNVLPNAGIDIGRSGIVDERRFYVTNMGNENPVTAADYLDYPRMRAMVEEIDEHRQEGGVILPSFNYDEWYVAQLPEVMPKGAKRQVTVYFLNLGMTSMNAPLDVRVVDQMGLAYPLAAHTERLEDGRIGHDKILPSEWVVAESGAYPRRPILPNYLDEDLVRQAQVALTCPETKARFASFEGPWTFARFKSNLAQAVDFSDYRIAREPEYEIQRCGLQMPPRINPR